MPINLQRPYGSQAPGSAHVASDSRHGVFALLVQPQSWLTKLLGGGGRRSKEAAEEALDPFIERYSTGGLYVRGRSDDGAVPGGPALTPVRTCARTEGGASGLRKPSPTASAVTPSKFVFSSGGLAVRPSACEDAGDVVGMGRVHRSPQVQCDEARKRVVVFFGYLSNAHELELQRETPPTPYSTSGGSPRSAPGFAAAGTPSHATRTVLALYDRLGPSADLLQLLAGQFAVVVYDEPRGAAFAARSTVPGDEPLFFSVNEDGDVLFTNSLQDLPPEGAARLWREIPPGHYVSGRDAVLRQFALTREQLAQREAREDAGEALDEDLTLQLSADSTPGGSPTLTGASLFRRLSARLSIS